MKILHLRFKNLNSLEGEWAIDLTHPAFVLDGLFAITGPTGAGKSTILDAVCLALYGRTPRLNKVTKAGNEIMSRRTGECFAEVTFETQAGRFRCHWSQHRARKKPDGELQAPKHELADADSGRILETKILDVGKQIEKATGMDFDRFTRSMLLAQGGFTAFLQAPPDERAPILEQITGTEIYSRISIRVHERQREERDKLERLRAETAGIAMLEPEQEQGLQLELEAKLKEETDLARQVTDTGAAIGWLTAIEGLRKDIAGLAEEELRLQGRFEAFQPERDKLSRAIQAAALDGSHATLVTLRKQQAEDRAALKTGEAALPELASAAQKQAMALAGAEQQTAQAKEELKAAAPLIRQVRALDQRLAHQKQELAAGEKDCRKVLEKMAVDRRARLEEEGRRAEAAKNLELAEAYLRDQARDEWLIGGLAGVEEQAAGLLSKQQEIALKEAELNEAGRAFGLATQKLEEAATQSGLSKQNVEAASLKLQRGQEALDRLLGSRLLREYRAEQEALLRELAFLKTIAKLEDHRARLEDGKPCPLCGATEHPFALGQVPAADETEKRIEALARLIAQAEDQEAAIKKLEEAKTAAGQDLTESEKREAAAAHDKKAAGKTLAEVTASLEKLRAGLRDQRQALGAKLLGLGIPELPAADISSLLESLRARLTAWQAQVRKKAEFEHQLAGCDSAMKTLDAVLETQGQALAEKQERLAALRREFAAGGDERKRAYGDKDPDQEELRLNRAAAEAEKAEKVARERHSERLWKWHSAQAQVESLKKRLGEREAGLKKSEAEFIAALEAAGFRDEERFLKARLTPQQRNELAAQAKELDDRQTTLRGIKKDQETRLTREIGKKVTDRSLAELEPRFKESEEDLKELRELMAGLRHRLRENLAAKERLRDKQTAIEVQKKECRRWDDLHALIGAADGKKYRNFAQGLTFEMMVGHANRQLRKMTDRYLLVRDAAQPLELNVIDNYQAGEVRSTKNLSGGESFIVSLSLALGLSHMASRNVRVDSLFLDEGFGTLDEEALETALETLASLHQDGKLIGVISHVSALKERISAQIQVIPQTGGKSAISGPGCQRL